MKKQINPTIKAHLIRSAFYLLLLVAVCAIPFALASLSRGTGKQSVTKPAAKPNAAANIAAGFIGTSRTSAECGSNLTRISAASRSTH